MLIYLLRHGLTEYNAQKRYQGQRDIPLSPEGAAQLRKADFDPDVVYVTPLQRTSQTAKIVFPHAKLVVVDGLKEMCFGSFEGRNFIEMEHDPDYQAWVQANCESSCPDGERKEDFSNRICAAFSKLVDEALAEEEDRLVILAHGGTQMAAMERYGRASCRIITGGAAPMRAAMCWTPKTGREKHILTRNQDGAIYKECRRGEPMMTVWAVLGGFVLDALFGDPAWLPHPVVYMGKAISRLEKFLRSRLPKTPQGELLGGAVRGVLPAGGHASCSQGLVCWGAARLHPLLGLAVQMFWCGQALAARGLVQESTNVYKELKKPDLPGARKAVSRIVGRDTAEPHCRGRDESRGGDGGRKRQRRRHCAAALYADRRGAAGPHLQGHQHDGQYAGLQKRKILSTLAVRAAKLDDVANYIPSRLAGAAVDGMAAAFTRNDAKGRVAVSGGGTAGTTPAPTAPRPRAPAPGRWGCSWPGRPITSANTTPKPTIGDPLRPIEPEDILRGRPDDVRGQRVCTGVGRVRYAGFYKDVIMQLVHGGDWMGYRERFGRDALDFSANVSPLGLPEGVARGHHGRPCRRPTATPTPSAAPCARR